MNAKLTVTPELYKHRCERLSKLIALKAPEVIIRAGAQLIVDSVEGPSWRFRGRIWWVSSAPRWMMMLLPSTREIIRQIEQWEKESDDQENQTAEAHSSP